MKKLQLLLLLIFFLALFLNADEKVYNHDAVLKAYMAKFKNEPRTALIIGNADYKVFKKLNTPVNDAKSMSFMLKKLGFDIIYVTNASRKEMKDAVRNFYDKLKEKVNGVGLFYFAGHGIEVDNKNYLVPVGADIKEIEDIENECFSITEVTTRMSNAKNRANIIILDASRKNPFKTPDGDGLTTIKNANGIYIAYAAAPNQVAIEKPNDKNSLFTKHLLSLIDVKGLKIDDVFNEVRKIVYKESEYQQLPFVTTGLIGTFYFAMPDNIKLTDKDSANIDFNKLGVPILKTEDGKIFPYRAQKVPQIKEYTLSIKTIPEDCSIHFINKDTKYSYGMRLPEGDYEVLISKNGYISRKGDIPLHENLSFTVPLTKKPEDTKVEVAKKDDKKSEPPKEKKDEVGEFKVESALIWVDAKNALMWEKKTKENKNDEFDWKEANEYCSKLTLGKFKDWKLPSKEELNYLTTDKKYNGNFIIKELSTDIGEWGWYWSSSSKSNEEAYLIYFSDKNHSTYDKQGKYYVRCVRNAKK